MRLELHVASLAVVVPEARSHRSLLGTISHRANNHLSAPAGVHSRPPFVARAEAIRWCDEYSAPALPIGDRTTDLASRAVGAVLQSAPHAAAQVGSVLHAQCTLDQQMLASSCLRLQNDHFSGATSAVTVGQLGTAALPATLRLAAMEVCGPSLASVSASDKWMAPFVRRVPGLVTYADAGAACLVGAPEAVGAPIAIVEACVTSCRPPRGDLWTTPAEVQREGVLEHARDCIELLLSEVPGVARSEVLLSGDGYGAQANERLARACGLSPRMLDTRYADLHLSTAAPLWSLRCAIEASARQGEALQAVVWTATPAGHAGAIFVRCPGDAVETPGGFTSRGYAASAA